MSVFSVCVYKRAALDGGAALILFGTRLAASFRAHFHHQLHGLESTAKSVG